MRGACLALKMGLFLHAVGSVPPPESAAERNLLHCEGVNNHSYVCESGHCCGESQCCSYYYELWWFWMVWAIIFILCCCCVCHHRRTKHRLQQQQRQHEINLIAYREAHNFPSVPLYLRFLPNYLLPHYEEVVNRPPTPPPPYSALHTGPASVAASPLAPEQQEGNAVQPTPVSAVSNSLCCRLSTEESQPPALDIIPKADNKPVQTAQDTGVILVSDGLHSEGLANPLLKDLSEGCTDDKDRLPSGRRRRFTGDSGIELCVCGTRGSSIFSGAEGIDQEDKEIRELESLLRHEGDDDEDVGDFCDSCGHQVSFALEDEQELGGTEGRVTRGLSGPHISGSISFQPPVCLLLHTINEQEAPQHSTSTEPQE